MTNILLVEDDKEIVKNLSLFSQEEGFRVRAVSGQKDALEQIEEHGQRDRSGAVRRVVTGWQRICCMCGGQGQ